MSHTPDQSSFTSMLIYLSPLDRNNRKSAYLLKVVWMKFTGHTGSAMVFTFTLWFLCPGQNFRAILCFHWQVVQLKQSGTWQWSASRTMESYSTATCSDITSFQFSEGTVYKQTCTLTHTHTAHVSTFCADGEGGVPQSLGWELPPQRGH